MNNEHCASTADKSVLHSPPVRGYCKRVWSKPRNNLCLFSKVWTKEVKKMKKIKLSIAIALIVGAVGISYALFTLKGMPDAFDWDNENE